jgi:integrase
VGVPEVTLHKLRHYHASLLLAATLNAKVVQQRLGHATVGMTQRGPE